MSAWDACTHEPSPLIRWFECHPGSAGWAQAAGTVGAIFVAIGVPLFLTWRARRAAALELNARASSLVSSLILTVYLLDNEVVRASGIVRSAGPKGPGPTVLQWFAQARLTIPPQLLEAVPDMHGMPGKIVGPFRDCATLSTSYNEYLGQFERIHFRTLESWQGMLAQLQKSLDLLSRAIANAQRLVDEAVHEDESYETGAFL